MQYKAATTSGIIPNTVQQFKNEQQKSGDLSQQFESDFFHDNTSCLHNIP